MADETAVDDVTLSIVIPSRDRPLALGRLLSRLSDLTKELSDVVEVIVVDDGSREPAKLPADARNARLVRQRPKGANPAREAGLKLAHGGYVHFHDSDDDFDDRWFTEVLSRIRSGWADVVLTGRREVLPHGAVRERISRFARDHARYPAAVGSRLRYENTLGPFGGLVFRRTILASVEFLPLHACQDWQVYCCLPWPTLRVVVIDAPLLVADKCGGDRISTSIRRRTLGHFQHARTYAPSAKKRRMLSLFYLWRLRHALTDDAAGHGQRLWRQARIRATLVAIPLELRLSATHIIGMLRMACRERVLAQRTDFCHIPDRK